LEKKLEAAFDGASIAKEIAKGVQAQLWSFCSSAYFEAMKRSFETITNLNPMTALKYMGMKYEAPKNVDVMNV
jgi:hypothetical protein